MSQKLNARPCLSKEEGVTVCFLLLKTPLFVYLLMLQCIEEPKELLP